MPTRLYYKQRSGAELGRFSVDQLARQVAAIYTELEDAGYFQEVLGYQCVDRGHVPGLAGSDLDAYIVRKTMVEGVRPLRDHLMACDEVTLFTLIEFLYDRVSKPTKGSLHDWNSCGWHFTHFDNAAGQVRWRDELNGVLSHYGEGFQLVEGGEVQRVGPLGLRDVFAATIPASAGDVSRDKIVAAIKQFRHGTASRKQRQDAVRELADVLEFYRPQVKSHLLTKDESDLFNIANNYAIRHHNEKQKADYDPAWLSWMFYLYLSSIHLVLRLMERDAQAGSNSST